jgi:type VI secretion system secreted protein VgrG
MEVYEDWGLYGYKDAALGDEMVKRRIEQIEAAGKDFQGASYNPYLQPGRTFVLDNEEFKSHAHNEDEDDLTFLVMTTVHIIKNNFGQGREGASYKNAFTCLRRMIPWRPAQTYKHTVPASMTALVVGPAGQEIHTDQYGRVRVQFHWDREGAYDDRSSAWIRVASSWAGHNFGEMAIPRVNQEVVVTFINGNPDRPVITGRVYNQDNMPPWELASQKALMGIKSKEIDGVGFGHLIMDDTPQQVQTQLSSTHELSQLNLGYIVRIPDVPGRKDFRGEGFELRTDGWGAIRAARGMHLSTFNREKAASYTKDISEATEQLERAYERHERMAGNAQDNGCQKANDDQTKGVEALKEQNNALKGGGGEQPEINQPHILLASPAGIETTTRGSTHISSEEHTLLTSGGDVAIASDKNLFMSMRQAIKLFAQRSGIKMLAAKGDIDVTALSDTINFLAKVKITAKSDEISVEAKTKLTLNGGGSTITLNGSGITEKTGGSHTVFCANHSITKGGSSPVNLSLKSPTERPCSKKRAEQAGVFASC